MEKYKARQDLSIYPVKAAFSHSWWPDQFEGKGGRTHKSSQMILLSSPEKKYSFHQFAGRGGRTQNDSTSKGRRPKKLFFFTFGQKGGGLGQSKKILSENTQIF